MFMLAVICMLLSADAQSVVNETTSCNDGSDTLKEIVNMVTAVISNQQQNAREIRDVKSLLLSESMGTNETSFEDVVREMKNEMKTEIRDEMRDVKNTITSECEQTNETRVMAVSYTHLTLPTNREV